MPAACRCRCLDWRCTQPLGVGPVFPVSPRRASPGRAQRIRAAPRPRVARRGRRARPRVLGAHAQEAPHVDRPVEAATRSCTCTCTPSTRCSTARPSSTTCSPRPRGMGMPALAMTDHGNVFGAYDFWKKATTAGVKPIIGIEGYFTPGHARLDRTRVRLGRRRRGERRRLRRQGAYTHMTLLARDDRGHAQPLPASPRWPASRASTASPGWTATCCERYGDGPHRHHRLPVRRGADMWLRARQVRGPRAAGGGRLPGHLRQGELLRRADGPRAGIEKQSPSRTCCASPRTSASRCVATNDLHYTHERGRAGRTTRCCASSPARRSTEPNRFKFDGDGYYLKSAGGDARAVRATCPRPATTRCSSPSGAR